MVHQIQFVKGVLEAGSDANKGFYVFGVDAGKQFNCCAACFDGGDSNELYGLAIIPPTAAAVQDVTIDISVGMVTWMDTQKGAPDNPVTWTSIANGRGVMVLPGPCSVVMFSNSAVAAAATTTLFGTISDLGESL